MKNKMKKQIIISTIIILSMISIVSAITIFSGACYSIEFPNSDPVEFNVSGNSSDMNGFTYNKTGTTITYCLHPLYKPDNFTITFYNYQSVEVTDDDDDGSSGGGGYYTYPWRNKVNVTSNESIVNETINDINESAEDIDEIIDEPKYKKGWLIFVICIIIIAIIGFIIYYSMKE